MTGLEWPDWASMLVPDLSLLESCARASLIYLALIVLFRVVLKRQAGTVGLPDMMLVVLVSECVSSALHKDAQSIPNGLVAVGSLLGWNYALDRLASRWKWLERRLEARPVEIIRGGEVLRDALAAEGISDDELATQLREHGIDDVARVKSAVMESDGAVSVIPEDGIPESAPPRGRALRARAAKARMLEMEIAVHERLADEHRNAAAAAQAMLAECRENRSRGGRRAGKNKPKRQ